MSHDVIDIETGTFYGKAQFISQADALMGALAIADYNPERGFEKKRIFIKAPLIPIGETADKALKSKKFYGNRDPIHVFSKNTFIHRDINGIQHTLKCEPISDMYNTERAAHKALEHLKAPQAYDVYEMMNDKFRVALKYWKPNPKISQIMLPAGRTILEAINAPIGTAPENISYMHEGNSSSIVTETIPLKELKKTKITEMKKSKIPFKAEGGILTLKYHKLNNAIYQSDHTQARLNKNLDLFGDVLFKIEDDQEEGSGRAMNPEKL